MSEAAATSRSAWIVGPRYDLLFFSTGWLLPLLVAAPLGSLASGLPAGFFTIWVYHLFIRLPHFGAMFLNTYLRREQLDYFREHWVRYFVVPVAILGSSEFDVGTIDETSLVFGGLGVRLRGNGGAHCSYEDVNTDGFADLVCQFADEAGAWTAGDETAALTGQLQDATPILGEDEICLTPN